MTKHEKNITLNVFMFLGMTALVIGIICWLFNDPDKQEPKPKQEQIQVQPTEAVNEMTLYRYKNGEIGTLPNHPQAGRGEQIFNR